MLRMTSLRTALTALAAACSIAPASGQRTDPAAPLPLLRTDAPYSIPSLGLSVFLPEDSLVDLSRLESGRTEVRVWPQGGPSWQLRIHNSLSVEHDLSAEEALTRLVDAHRDFYTGKDARGRTVTLVREFDRAADLIVGQHPAVRAYVDVPVRPEVPVTGYTIFETGPGQFVIFQLDCPVDSFLRVRNLYETMVAGAVFRDAESMGSDRAAAILAGEALLRSLASADLVAALDPEPQLYRLYLPSPDGDPSRSEEVGYQRVQIRKGQAGELDQRRRRDSWTAADKAEGFLVRVEARILSRDTVIDSNSAFFLSPDFQSEMWSVTMTLRRGSDAENWYETGIRRGDRLTVRTGGEPTSADWSPLPKSYASRALVYLLPRLAAKTGTQGHFGFYNYDSQLAKITLRRETFARTADGGWTQTTLPSENSAPMTTDLDESGRILRRVMADGQVMEPVDPQNLRRLWATKRLPID